MRGGAHRTALTGLAIGSAAVATAAVAERRTVARWAATDDRHRDEPVSIGDALAGAATSTVTSSDGAELAVVEGGAGPTVVLAHGVTATVDHWAPVAARLVRAGCRVVAFDHRGHGRSTAGSGAFRADLLGDDVDAVVGATAPDGAVVVGHSMGGIAVLAWLAGHPDAAATARGLALVATLHRPVGNAMVQLMRRLGGTSLARRTMAHPVHGRIMARGGLGDRPSMAVLDVVRGGWAACPDATRAGVFRDLAFDHTDLLSTIAVPTVVICGDRDRVTPLAESRLIDELIPGARLTVVPGAGHEVIWEAADVVADAIAELARRPGGST